MSMIKEYIYCAQRLMSLSGVYRIQTFPAQNYSTLLAQEDLRGNEESNLEKRQSFLRFGRGGKTETAFKNIFKL